ncbi:hypothetical protein HQ576_02855 [bacterium]|nr:hypothetical protein [bacterium]
MTIVSTLCRVLVAGLLWGGVAAGATPAVKRPWFDDLEGETQLTPAQGLALVRWAAEAVAGRPASPDSLPEALRADRAPRLAFVTISDGIHPARTALGRGQGLAAAIADAAAVLLRRLVPGWHARWVKLDVVRRATPVRLRGLKSGLALAAGLKGLALDRQSGIALEPGLLLGRGIVSAKGRLDAGKLRAHFADRPDESRELLRVGQAKTATAFVLDTHSFFLDGTEAHALFRGHRVTASLEPEALLEAARLAGGSLARIVGPDGSFVYSHDPSTGRTSPSYNILRHGGTVYAMLELFEATREKALLDAAERAIRYLVAQVVTVRVGQRVFPCIAEGGYVKLGGNALAIVALARHAAVTGDRRHLPLMQRLAGWMLATQKADGRFGVHKLRVSDGRVMDVRSDYYPGESLLALVRLHALDGDARWLDAAEKGAGYLINVRDLGLALGQLNHDHWLLYALNELYRVRRKALYVRHSFRIVDAILLKQNRNPGIPDWHGSYYRPPRSTPTATRSEGLAAAYQLARDFDTPDRAARILEGIRLGVAFQLRTQFRPESVLYFDDPQQWLGAFRESLTGCETRIDFTQHNISALLGLRRILLAKAKRPD